ncbi:hypothetical protein, partial [Pseudomonas sp. PS01299]|uniref:hypothetical protein n=1 Tax=Pseudomonas sp. PS01299 TaxID=2991435 RepID=UPI00249CC2AF
MDLLARGTCVPAVTARGAIVEKGLRRCKAIGDYLNNHHFFAFAQNTVGAGLLANAFHQATLLLSDTPLSRASP